jgi:lipid-A-disaccharide synthase
VASSDKLSIAMVAGEPSGDLLASRLLSGLRPSLPDARMHGIGGPQMQRYGFQADWPMEKLSVRGLFEVLAHYREIKQIQNSLRDKLLAEKPAVFIGVDAPDFNFGLEAQLKQAGVPTSPSIWAWRGGRIKKVARAVSHMLVVFPFEEAIYRDAGIPVTYVGYPLAEVIPMQPDVHAARLHLGLPQDVPVVTSDDYAGQPHVGTEIQLGDLCSSLTSARSARQKHSLYRSNGREPAENIL